MPSFQDIVDAAGRVSAFARRTPLLRIAVPDSGADEVFVKAECLQISGSFKVRGAYNRLSRLTKSERARGVVAWSSGNHAQGVAAAAALLDISATIVMPADAPAIKTENTRRLGAEIVFYDRKTESREDIARHLCAERGAVLVPSYDDFHIIAGQGTLGLEMHAQLEEADVALDSLLVCCGGGGLIAGVSLAFQHLSPATRLYAVEPEAFDDHARSLRAGTRVSNPPGGSGLCDALLAPTPGELTWEINRHTLAGGLTVSDAEVYSAMRFGFRDLKLVAEPGGAAALAALLSRKLDFSGQRVGVVITGGNVDSHVYREALG